MNKICSAIIVLYVLISTTCLSRELTIRVTDDAYAPYFFIEAGYILDFQKNRSTKGCCRNCRAPMTGLTKNRYWEKSGTGTDTNAEARREQVSVHGGHE